MSQRRDNQRPSKAETRLDASLVVAWVLMVLMILAAQA